MRTVNPLVSPDIYLQLLKLREQLSAFQTVSCKLNHEQVQELVADCIIGDQYHEQLAVKRRGFCKADMRKKWLGCAHTMANDRFANLVNELYETGVLQMDTNPAATIKTVVMKIYLMDHEKGNLEKQLAFAKFKKQQMDVESLQAAIEEVISRHQTTIHQLEECRYKLMHQLDTVIENYNRVS